MKRVLVIEDDQEIIELLKIHLSDLGCEVSKSMDGEEGLRNAVENSYDLIILDLSLPSMDGIEVCRNIRKNSSIPIIMLTAKTEEIDKVVGLEMGADDYITKPFSIREFLARVKAIFRRTSDRRQSENEPTDNISIEDLSIDFEKRKVLLNGNKIELSPKEFELLHLMASHPGKNFSRSDLLRLIWGYDFNGYEHTVNSHINRLRSKIESDMNEPRYILTSWGIGYKFNEDLI